MTKALVVIDVQKGMWEHSDYLPYDGDGVVERIAGLIAKARAASVPIFFVQHDGGPQDPLHPGKPGFPFHDKLAPQTGDDVTVKRHGSAFRETDIEAKLRRKHVDHVVVTGMQSQNCVDSFVRGAEERNFRITLVSDAHSTCDSRVLKAKDIIAHENDTLDGGAVTLKPAAEIVFA